MVKQSRTTNHQLINKNNAIKQNQGVGYIYYFEITLTGQKEKGRLIVANKPRTYQNKSGKTTH